MDTVSLILTLPFLRDALIAGTLVAIPMSLLSAFVVLRGWALMGDAISHAVLPGIVIAYIVGLPFIVGAFAAGMTCTALTGYLQAGSRIKSDTVLGIVFSGMFGLGVLLYTTAQPDVHLDHILFGNLLGVGRADMITAGVIAILVSALLLARFPDFTVEVFDPTHGRAIGLRIDMLHVAMLVMITLAVIAALSVSGLILAVAFLISPGAIARLWTRTLRGMMALSLATGILSVWAGLWLSVRIDSAPAPSIVVILTLAFLTSFGWKLVRIR